MKLLFICNQGENRSRTAKELFDGNGHTARCAGLYNDKQPVTTNLLRWADIVFVFEERQLEEIKNKYPDLAFEKRIINLDIMDFYPYNNPELIELMKKKILEWISC